MGGSGGGSDDDGGEGREGTAGWFTGRMRNTYKSYMNLCMQSTTTNGVCVLVHNKRRRNYIVMVGVTSGCGAFGVMRGKK